MRLPPGLISEAVMKLEILGSGGSIPTPKMLCTCDACTEAKKLGFNYHRLGPSVFVHGPDILIDTPDEISVQINRSQITNIHACLYSHWHPDHTAGRRVFEAGMDYSNIPAQNKATKVIITEKIAETFETFMAIMDHFNFMEHMGSVKKQIIGNDEIIEIEGYKIQPIQLAQDYVFGYKIWNGEKSILIFMDELKDWEPSKELLDAEFDLVYLPFGILNKNPFTNTFLRPVDHPLYQSEHSIEETLEYVSRLNAKKFILSHIEEGDNITHELADKLEKYYSELTGKNITIAKDQMLLEI